MADREPLVSILMPAYNCGKFVGKAIESIMNQSHKNWELLICNDASTDKSLSIIQRLSHRENRIIVRSNEANLGYLKTCNLLFKSSTGDFITFQDADDWSHPDRLKRQVEEFKVNSTLGICGTFAQYYDESGSKKTIQTTPSIYDKDIKLGVENNNQFCGASIMIRKEVLEQVGVYREYFNRVGNEDYDWSARIVERFTSGNIPEYLYFVRQTQNSATRVIKNEKQLVSADLVKFFISQRKKGSDYLELNDNDGLGRIEEELLLPYRRDPSLVYRDFAASFMYNRLFKKAIVASVSAIKFQPFKSVNYRTLFYCIRKSLSS